MIIPLLGIRAPLPEGFVLLVIAAGITGGIITILILNFIGHKPDGEDR